MAEPVPPRLDDIDYQEIAPGVLSFRCQRYACRLSAVSCRSRYRQAAALVRKGMSPAEIGGSKCLSCPIGAAHSGEPMSNSKAATLKICHRCGTGGSRIVGTGLTPPMHVCISDYNRALEVQKGANRKNTTPQMHAHLGPVTVRYRLGAGEPQRYTAPMA